MDITEQRGKLESYSRPDLERRCIMLENKLKQYEQINVFSNAFEAAFYVVKKEWPSISEEAMKGPSRITEVVSPRHMAMFLLATVAKVKLKAIGRFYGGRDHSSVISARDKITDISSYDKRERERMIRCVRLMKTLLIANGL